MNERNRRIITILSIFTIIFTLMGGTLAYWTWTSTEITGVAFTISKDFSCSADGGQDLTSANIQLQPTADCTNSEVALQRTIKVTPDIKKDGLTINLNMWLNVNTLGDGLSKSINFKYALTTSDSSCTEGVISTGNFNGLNTGDKVKLLDQSYSSSTPTTYYLYIWLDKVETSSTTQNQEFDLSLGGECDDKVYNDLMFNVATVNNKNTFGVNSGFYTLSSYTCDNGTTLSYDTNSKIITSNGVDKCDLNFTSVEKKLYDVVEIGDYIEYFGNNGCTGQQCNGWNVGQTGTDSYENYGSKLSSNTSDKPYFSTYGWRVLYKNDNSVYIVSAGVPEFLTFNINATSAITNMNNTINKLNDAAKKYCNSSYLSNGICNYNTTHAFNNDDFYNFTSQYYGEENARHLDDDYGSNYCMLVSKSTYCGYNNDIIDIGIGYMFGSGDVLSNFYRVIRYRFGDQMIDSTNMSTSDTEIINGFRPVLKLDASVLATGGNGTMKNPYTISERAGL